MSKIHTTHNRMSDMTNIWWWVTYHDFNHGFLNENREVLGQALIKLLTAIENKLIDQTLVWNWSKRIAKGNKIAMIQSKLNIFFSRVPVKDIPVVNWLPVFMQTMRYWSKQIKLLTEIEANEFLRGNKIVITTIQIEFSSFNTYHLKYKF